MDSGVLGLLKIQNSKFKAKRFWIDPVYKGRGFWNFGLSILELFVLPTRDWLLNQKIIQNPKSKIQNWHSQHFAFRKYRHASAF
jgi:hypothetical protein